MSSGGERSNEKFHRKRESRPRRVGRGVSGRGSGRFGGRPLRRRSQGLRQGSARTGRRSGGKTGVGRLFPAARDRHPLSGACHPLDQRQMGGVRPFADRSLAPPAVGLSQGQKLDPVPAAGRGRRRSRKNHRGRHHPFGLPGQRQDPASAGADPGLAGRAMAGADARHVRRAPRAVRLAGRHPEQSLLGDHSGRTTMAVWSVF